VLWLVALIAPLLTFIFYVFGGHTNRSTGEMSDWQMAMIPGCIIWLYLTTLLYYGIEILWANASTEW
jgi:ABC-type polysaccharide/polyol phosphate export permease